MATQLQPPTQTSSNSKFKTELYVWTGVNRKGEKLKGEQSAGSPTLLKVELRRQGITPNKIRKKGKRPFQRKHKVKGADITAFSRQMATMMVAGIPLIQSLDLIGKGHSNTAMQAMIESLKSSIEGGSSIAEALAKFPKYFNVLYKNLIGAGERSGSLDIMFDRIATYKEKTDTLLGKIKKALYYPAAIVVVAFAVTAILLIFVIPQFQSLFSGFGATLPAPTRMVISLSNFVRAYWWLIAAVIAGGIWFIRYSLRHFPKAQYILDTILLRLPILGTIIRKATIARFARTLSTTFAAGLPLVDALTAVAGATGNVIYSDATTKIRDEVSSGQTLQIAVRQSAIFPNMVVQMIAIGEESGTLENMLGKVADIYEREVDNAVDSLSSLLEPFIMVILGVLIGGLVIAMYLPIFKLGSVV